MGVDFEHFLIARYNGGDAAHVDNALANGLNVETLPTQQENDFVPKFLFNGDAPLFDGGFPRPRDTHCSCCDHRGCSLHCLTTHVAPDSFQDGTQSLSACIDDARLLERRKKVGSASN